MFEQQTITIESGDGKNHFKANAALSSIVSPNELQIIMDGLRKMQKDRMEWAATQK